MRLAFNEIFWRWSRVAGSCLAALAVTACASADDPCGSEPKGNIVAFFTDRAQSRQLSAEVSSIEPIPAGGGYHYHLSAAGSEYVFAYRAASVMPGVAVGGRYEFMVEYSPGYPDASAIIVRQNGDLIFAAITDQRPGAQVLKGGLDGFHIELGPSKCGSRGRTRCHEALINRSVVISYEDQSLELHHGQRADLGPFIVDVLTAQSVSYAKSCSDAGLVGLSLSISRRK